MSAAIIQPQTKALPPSCLTVSMAHLSLYSSHGFYHTCLIASWPPKNYLGLIRPQDMIPLIHVLSLLVFSKLRALSYVEGACFWDTALQIHLMQCMAWTLTGWHQTASIPAAMLVALIHAFSEVTPFRWRWTQFLWSTMESPVLSGNCPV